MKKLLFVFILGLSMTCYSQEFAPLNAKWHFGNWYLPTEGPITYSVIKSASDTIIDDKYCTVIHLYDNNGVDFVTDLIVHEDQGKVYFYETEEFKLFFDYNLNAGDTLAFRVPQNAVLFQSNGGGPEPVLDLVYYALIENKEEIEINGILLYEFQTSAVIPEDADGSFVNWNLDTFTQRIGTSMGLFGRSGVEILGGYPGFYRCYEDDEISIHMTPLTPCDETTVNIVDIKNTDILFTYPNPVNDFLKIRLSKETCNNIYLIDSNGKVVKSYSVYGQNELELNLTKFPSGTYFLRAECDENEIIHEKIIKK